MLKKFRDAWEGVSYTVKSERNMRIHVGAAAAVMLAAWWIGFSSLEWVLLLLTIAMVMVAETVNTAVEKTVDIQVSTYHPLAKLAKNTAAGAVLLAAIFAVVIGFILFYDKVAALLR